MLYEESYNSHQLAHTSPACLYALRGELQQSPTGTHFPSLPVCFRRRATAVTNWHTLPQLAVCFTRRATAVTNWHTLPQLAVCFTRRATAVTNWHTLPQLACMLYKESYNSHQLAHTSPACCMLYKESYSSHQLAHTSPACCMLYKESYSSHQLAHTSPACLYALRGELQQSPNDTHFPSLPVCFTRGATAVTNWHTLPLLACMQHKESYSNHQIAHTSQADLYAIQGEL